MSTVIGDNDLIYLEGQERFLANIVQSIRLKTNDNPIDLKEIADNIRQLKEEIKDAKPDDLPGLYHQLNLQYSLASKLSQPEPLPDTHSPYFGHMCLLENERKKHIFLGHVSFLDGKNNIRIVDWKKAPISQVFYQYGEGDDYDIDIGDNELEGVVHELSILTIENEKLIRVDRNGQSFVKIKDRWTSLEEENIKLGGGQGSACRDLTFGTGLTNFKGPEVVGLLDHTQYELLNRSFKEPLLIIGGAGSGKTTVALHRIATLCKRKKLMPHDVLVIVPHKGLIHLSEELLKKIGLKRVRIKIGENWIQQQAERLFPGIPRRICLATPLGTSLLKRHLCFLKICQEYINEQIDEIASRLDRLSRDHHLGECFRQYSELSILERIEKIEREIPLTAIQKIKVNEEKNIVFDVLTDLRSILTNRKRLKKACLLSDGVITERMVETTFLHSARQLHAQSDDGHTTLDGQSADDGSAFAIHNTIDLEDHSLLIYLLKLKTNGSRTAKGHIKKYRHMVIDEAQELAPVELMAFKEGLHPQGTFTIAGDAAQQVDESISFSSWEQLLGHLDIKGVSANELTISYRSPQSIVEFAHNCLGDLISGPMPTSPRQGAPVRLNQIQHMAHGSIILFDTLDDLIIREPKASIAIICSKMETARNFYSRLKDLGQVRLVEDADFTFRPGIDVTTVEQIRGLEFDYVIIPDGDHSAYPDTPRARKRLHLAATRAIHQLWVLYAGKVSPIISSFDSRQLSDHE